MGTSMAAPVVAGNIALIRQYLVDKNFWSKLCNPDYPLCSTYKHSREVFMPKGSLIKALVLHSGQPMTM